MKKIKTETSEKIEIPKQYNTAEGITKSLTSLNDFQNLLKERHAAGYQRKENLTEFFVMGYFYLDSSGNCMKAEHDMKKILPSIPNVIEKEALWEFFRENLGETPMIAFSRVNLPQANIICPVCKKPWTIDDCYDSMEYTGAEEEKIISLKDFVGKTLYEVQAAFDEKTDAIYRMNQSELIIRNDRFIDLTPDPDYAEYNEKYPDNKIVMNKHGWLGEKAGIDGNYVVQKGDDGYFNIWRYYHHSCNHQRLNEAETTQFERIFEKAGFKELDVKLLSTENQYCPCDYCACWFNVNTIYGTGILIGWRKRVINIDWSQWGYDFSYLFPDEDVTKWDSGIHAWGEEKAIEYLAKIAAEIKGSEKIKHDIMTYKLTHKKDL